MYSNCFRKSCFENTIFDTFHFDLIYFYFKLDTERQNQENLKAEIDRLNTNSTDEKNRHKQIVLCLLQDRRRLAVLLSEERSKNKNASTTMSDHIEKLNQEIEQVN